MKKIIRKSLIDLAHRLEVGAKRLRSAADKAIPEKRIFLHDCEAQGWRNLRPCFVLSTGRSGTRLLNDLLLLSEDALPEHEPRPELYRPSRRAYEDIEQHPEIYREVFKSAREEYLLKAAQQEKVYIETNNQCTFFAPVMRDIFPHAVFIHLVRHPGDFVRSGIRRKWYTGAHSHDIGRIVPVAGEMRDRWAELSLIEKNGWLWNETNRFIEDFRRTVPAEAFLFVKAEALFRDPAVTREIFDFLRIGGYQEKTVRKVIGTPVNVQKKGHFPAYRDWPEADKTKLKKVAPRAAAYHYDLD